MRPGAATAASLLAVIASLLAAVAWQALAQPFGPSGLAERHARTSARLDGMMICMLQVEMAHARYLASGQPHAREERDKALATLGAALRATDAGQLEETGHAARFNLIQQHALHRLPAWLDAHDPSPAPARGVLRTGGHTALAPSVPGEAERRLAARESEALDALLAERGQRALGARLALSALAGVAAVMLCLLATRGARLRGGRTLRAAGKRHAALEHAAAIAARERQRISRDMHDSLGQDLFALKLELERFHARTRREHPPLHAGVGQMLGLADDVMANLRAVIDDLRPDDLAQGLEAAIHSQAAKFRRRAPHVDLRVDLSCGEAALGQHSATACFRILQEALANVRRHARATQVRVQLAQRDRHLCLSVADDGCGFDPAAACKDGSFGLAGMRERVDALGGRLAIDSAPGRGTRLTVTLPLAPSASPPGGHR